MRRYMYRDDFTLMVPHDVYDDPGLLDMDERDVAWAMHERAKRQADDVDRAKAQLASVDDPTAILDEEPCRAPGCLDQGVHLCAARVATLERMAAGLDIPVDIVATLMGPIGWGAPSYIDAFELPAGTIIGPGWNTFSFPAVAQDVWVSPPIARGGLTVTTDLPTSDP